MGFITEGHVVACRSRDGFYGWAEGGWLKGRWTVDLGEGDHTWLQQPGQGPMMIILSGISAGYVIL